MSGIPGLPVVTAAPTHEWTPLPPWVLKCIAAGLSRRPFEYDLSLFVFVWKQPHGASAWEGYF